METHSRKLEVLANELGLFENKVIAEKIDPVMIYTGRYVHDKFTSVVGLMTHFQIEKSMIALIAKSASINRTDGKSYEELVKDLTRIAELTKDYYNLRRDHSLAGNQKFREFRKTFASPNKAVRDYFDNSRYGAQEILDLGLLFDDPTSQAVLAWDLFRTAGINAQVMKMSKSGFAPYSIVRYQLEDGSWRRCDPKGQKKLCQNGTPLFFEYHPELAEEFFSERRPFLNGTEYLMDESAEFVLGPDDKRIHKEYETEERIR